MQRNFQPGRLLRMKKILLVIAVALACLVPAGAAQAADLVYSLSTSYPEAKVRSGIYTSRPNGSERVRLTRGKRDEQATWSPDRTHIAFTRFHRSTDEIRLFVMGADGSDKTIIWSGRVLAGFDWAPDSQRLVVSGDGDLYVIGREGTAESQLTDDPGAETEPDWSPDGSKIAFTGAAASTDPTAPDPRSDIYVVPSEGGEPIQITTDPDDDMEAVWSPDSTRIAFIGTRGHCCEDEYYGSDLYVVNGDGSDERRLTDDCTWEGSLEWLPDGNSLVYEEHADDDACYGPYFGKPINVIDVETGDKRALLSERWYVRGLALSPSGTWVAFSAYGGQDEGQDLFRVRISDKRVRQITDNKAKAEDDEPDW